MDKREQIWRSLRDPEYRREFSNDVGTGLAFQIRMLREKRGWTQEQLADRTGKRQETISQWENPDYGSYTLNTLRSLAGAFDVALVVKFAPFSELVDWTSNLTPERLAPVSFDEDRLAEKWQEGFVWTTTAIADPIDAVAQFGTATNALMSEPTGGYHIADETAPVIKQRSQESRERHAVAA